MLLVNKKYIYWIVLGERKREREGEERDRLVT